MRPDILIAAVGASATSLAAAAVEVLRQERPAWVIEAVGGAALGAAGARRLGDAPEASAIGPSAAFAALPQAARAWWTVHQALARRPRILLTVDAPGLWLTLGRRPRQMGTRWMHWVAPQIWASRPERAGRVAAQIDELLCLFPFEVPLWTALGARARVTGHPAASITPVVRRSGTLALAPGSRRAEVNAHLGLFADAASLVGARSTTVSRAPGVVDRVALPGVDGLSPLFDHEVALVASGTATLEFAAAGVPMVVAYRVGPVTEAWARARVSVPWVSWPNLLAGGACVEEHLGQPSAADLARAVDRTARRGDRVRADLLALIEPLRRYAPARACAEAVLEAAERRS